MLITVIQDNLSELQTLKNQLIGKTNHSSYMISKFGNFHDNEVVADSILVSSIK